MIKTEDFDLEMDAIAAVVGLFAEKMRQKMRAKHLEGWSGWDEPDLQPRIEGDLSEHISKGFDRENLVDIANLSMILWNMLPAERSAPSPQQEGGE